ncbi:MAG: helix-turn-helix domain-containing protein [Chloroflexota bacterium]|nr:helix-turn-helix domain-containing protein [Chloroflexota bacterium]
MDEKVEPFSWHTTRMRAYCVDLRERVVAAVDRKMPRSDVAVLFGVSLATIKRWLTHRRTSGTRVPKTSPGRPTTIRPAQHAA